MHELLAGSATTEKGVMGVHQRLERIAVNSESDNDNLPARPRRHIQSASNTPVPSPSILTPTQPAASNSGEDSTQIGTKSVTPYQRKRKQTAGQAITAVFEQFFTAALKNVLSRAVQIIKSN